MGHVPTCSLVLGVIELFKASSLTLTKIFPFDQNECIFLVTLSSFELY